MFTLETFGGLSLRGADGPVTTRVSQRRRLALLAVLAAERRPVSRDKLVGLFWPESDAERGRHLLADSLYVVRTGLGENAIETFGDDVTLNHEVVASDVAAFLRGVQDGGLEEAVALYTGPFLDGVFISDAPEFERWTESMRDRLEGERRRCLERLATDAAARREYAQSVEWWRALASADRLSSTAAAGLIRALTAAGDRIGALQFARVHEEIVRAELDVEPDASVTSLVNELRLVRLDSTAGAALSTNRARSHVAPASASVETTPLTPRGARRLTRLRIGIVASVVALALIVGAIPLVRGVVSKTPTIAVLPFDAIGSDREISNTADAITDALTTKLDQLRQLQVMSRMSSSIAKRSAAAPAEIRKMLGTRYLVEGSVRPDGSKMRIDVALIDASRSDIIWSHGFSTESSPGSLMGVDDEIADSIAVALNLRRGRAVATGNDRSTQSKAAFDAYRTGAELLKSRNPADVMNSILFFTDAIHADTSYALAYAGLADAHASLAVGNSFDRRPEQDFSLARDAATAALKLDSTLAEAHATLGYLEALYNLDWKAASAEIDRALDLQPSYENAHVYRTILFEWQGDFGRAVAEANELYRLNHLDPLPNIELGRALFFAAQYDSARKTFEHVLKRDSSSLRAHMHLGQALVRQGSFNEGYQELMTAARLAPNSSRPIALLAHAYAVGKRRPDAMRLLDSLQRRSRERYVPAFDFAIVYAGLGDAPNAVAWLDSSFTDHSVRPYLWDPTFDLVRNDKRFRELLTRHHLSPP